jgi:hypothetical protein
MRKWKVENPEAGIRMAGGRTRDIETKGPPLVDRPKATWFPPVAGSRTTSGWETAGMACQSPDGVNASGPGALESKVSTAWNPRTTPTCSRADRLGKRKMPLPPNLWVKSILNRAI